MMNKEKLLKMAAGVMLSVVLVSGIPVTGLAGQPVTVEAAAKKKDKKKKNKKIKTAKPEFKITYDADKGNDGAFVVSGRYTRKAGLYLFNAKQKKPVARLKRISNVSRINRSTKYLFSNVKGLSKKEKKKLDKMIKAVKTPDDLITIWCLGGEVGNTTNKTEAKSLIIDYFNNIYIPGASYKKSMKKQIENEYGNIEGGYDYEGSYTLKKDGKYTLYVATKDKKIKTKKFTVKTEDDK